MKRKRKNDGIEEISSVSPKQKRRRRIRNAVNIAASVVLALSVFATGVMGAYAFGFANKVFEGLPNYEPPEEENKFEKLTVSTHSGVSYILVAGVDLSQNLTDVIVVVCMDHEKKTISCLQIPRDTFIGTDIPTMKINAVYGNPRKGEQKINALRRRLSSHLGIPLDHYVVFTVDGFRNVIDALGGIEINITQKDGMEIENQDNFQKYTIGPGWVTLDGNMAAGVVRKRYGSEKGYGRGDASRLETQRLVYVALCKKLLNMNPMQMFNIATTCYDQVTTDMTVNELVGYASEAKNVPFEEFRIFGLPGQNCNYNLSYYSVHKDDYVEMFNTYFNPYGTPITESGIKIRELHTELGYTKQTGFFSMGGSIQQIIDQQNQ